MADYRVIDGTEWYRLMGEGYTPKGYATNVEEAEKKAQKLEKKFPEVLIVSRSDAPVNELTRDLPVFYHLLVME